MKKIRYFFLFCVCVFSLHASQEVQKEAEIEGYDFKTLMESKDVSLEQINVILKSHPEIVTKDNVNVKKDGATILHNLLMYKPLSENPHLKKRVPPFNLETLLAIKADTNLAQGNGIKPLELAVGAVGQSSLDFGDIQKLVYAKAEITQEVFKRLLEHRQTSQGAIEANIMKQFLELQPKQEKAEHKEANEKK